MKLSPFTPEARARIKARRSVSGGGKPGQVTYTFARPTGGRGRPRHVSFTSRETAARVLGVNPSTIHNLVYGCQKATRTGVTFVRKSGSVCKRPVVLVHGYRGSVKGRTFERAKTEARSLLA